MEIYIGSIRVYGNSASFDVISDNTVRGAAGNSILLAEMMLAQGIIHDSSSVNSVVITSNKNNQLSLTQEGHEDAKISNLSF